MCIVDDCPGPTGVRGWCPKHYARWQRHGDPLYAKTIHGDPMGAFLQKVDKTQTCWLWTGMRTPEGYGHFRDSASGRTVIAHRWLYERAVGPIPLLPNGQPSHLDHLCHSVDKDCPGGRSCLHRGCVNPAHMEPVAPRENTRRGRAMDMQTHCKRGHEFTPENTWYNTKGNRGCKACRPIYRREKRIRDAAI